MYLIFVVFYLLDGDPNYHNNYDTVLCPANGEICYKKFSKVQNTFPLEQVLLIVILHRTSCHLSSLLVKFIVLSGAYSNCCMGVTYGGPTSLAGLMVLMLQASLKSLKNEK